MKKNPYSYAYITLGAVLGATIATWVAILKDKIERSKQLGITRRE